LKQTTSFFVTVQGSNKVENKKKGIKITVFVNPPAEVSDIILESDSILTDTFHMCRNKRRIIKASAPNVTNPVFTWYLDSLLTNVAHVNPNPKLRTDSVGEFIYYVTVRGDNKCENQVVSVKKIRVIVSACSVINLGLSKQLTDINEKEDGSSDLTFIFT